MNISTKERIIVYGLLIAFSIILIFGTGYITMIHWKNEAYNRIYYDIRKLVLQSRDNKELQDMFATLKKYSDQITEPQTRLMIENWCEETEMINRK
jgi:hypothetical protein